MRASSSNLLVAIFIFVMFLVSPFSLVMTMIGGARASAARSQSTNNLKQIGLALQNHNDTNNCLPYNGGDIDPDKLKGINFGWHNSVIRDSGTWATQILPFMEQDPFWRNNKLNATAQDKIPDFLKNAANNNVWQVTIRNYLCPGRGRPGFKSSTAAGCYPGVVTDYAINTFINSPPAEFSPHGFALDGGVAVVGSSRETIQGIKDGASNTIIVGGKALPPSIAANNDAKDWDEGIFSPGNYTAAKEKSTLTSTGTGRGHVIDSTPPKQDVNARPEKGGVPWMYEDSELAAKKGEKLPRYDLDWGSPFKEGVLFGFCDGTVRLIRYKSRGTVNFARMLYPNDGQVVVFD
jgi:hypothetical protein